MTKTVSLPDVIYADLVSVSGDLTSAAKKPISIGMAVAFLTSIFKDLKKIPGFEEGLKKNLSTTPLLSPEEFEEVWDKLSKQVIREKKKD